MSSENRKFPLDNLIRLIRPPETTLAQIEDRKGKLERRTKVSVFALTSVIVVAAGVIVAPIALSPGEPTLVRGGGGTLVGDTTGDSPSGKCDPVTDTKGQTVSPNEGLSGSSTELRLAIPTTGENGQYIPPIGEIQVWWNLDPDEWPTALSVSDAPQPEQEGDVLLLGSFNAEGKCEVGGTIVVPDVKPGTYSLVAIHVDKEGANLIHPPHEHPTFTVLKS